jgi:hypothetical protein
MAAPLNTIELHGVVWFLWAKGMAAKNIHKEMLPMYGEHCLSRQAVHNCVHKFSEERTSIKDEHRVGRPVEIATPAKNFMPQVSRDCEMVGKVFKFVWRLCWKINVVCMSFVSAFVCFHSRFVTYLLTSPHTSPLTLSVPAVFKL